VAKVLAGIIIASQYLQGKVAELRRTADHLRDAADNLAKISLDFQTVKEEATGACMTSPGRV